MQRPNIINQVEACPMNQRRSENLPIAQDPPKTDPVNDSELGNPQKARQFITEQMQEKMLAMYHKFGTEEPPQNLRLRRKSRPVEKLKKVSNNSGLSPPIDMSFQYGGFSYLGERLFVQIGKFLDKYDLTYNYNVDDSHILGRERHENRRQIIKYCLIGLEEMRYNSNYKGIEPSPEIKQLLDSPNLNENVKQISREIQGQIWKQSQRNYDFQLRKRDRKLYKEKMKDLYDNLKDSENFNLRSKILLKKLTGKNIVKMTDMQLMSERKVQLLKQNEQMVVAEAAFESCQKQMKNFNNNPSDSYSKNQNFPSSEKDEVESNSSEVHKETFCEDFPAPRLLQARQFQVQNEYKYGGPDLENLNQKSDEQSNAKERRKKQGQSRKLSNQNKVIDVDADQVITQEKKPKKDNQNLISSLQYFLSDMFTDELENRIKTELENKIDEKSPLLLSLKAIAKKGDSASGDNKI